jgi:phospholipase C
LVSRRGRPALPGDEHGGFYDHVVPPADDVSNPDGINSPAPDDRASFAPRFAFDRPGFRVPAAIASPWVKKGRVDSTRYQHTSVLATLKNLFGLPAFLTKRDASAAAFNGLLSEVAAPGTDSPSPEPLLAGESSGDVPPKRGKEFSKSSVFLSDRAKLFVF